MKTKTIKQSAILPGTPHAVYEALMDSKQHAAFTGSEAAISRKVGGKFSVWGDYAAGRNLELKPDRKIVQTWRASDWPEGHDSRVTFSLAKAKGGAKLTFVQTGVPEEFYADIKQGWVDYYWKPLKTFLRKSR